MLRSNMGKDGRRKILFLIPHVIRFLEDQDTHASESQGRKINKSLSWIANPPLEFDSFLSRMFVTL